jgi:hypothetical protein
LPSNTQGGSPVRESRSPGSVRGVLSNGHSYRDRPFCGCFDQKKTSKDLITAHFTAKLGADRLSFPGIRFV